MTEQDVRDGLRGAVAGEPPLDFDPDALVATARRETMRRALVSVSLATAVVAVAAVAVPVVLGVSRDDSGFGPAEQPSSTSTSVPKQRPTPVWPPTSIRQEEYTAAELRQRGGEMATHLEDRFVEVFPGTTDVVVLPFGGESTGDVSDGQDYLNAFAAFTYGGTRFAVGVNVFAPGAHPQGPDDKCDPDPSRCQSLGTVAGGQELAVEEEVGQRNQGLRLLSVYHFRPDGSVVSVVGYNYDPTAGTLPADPEPMPVTVEQLGTLAVDPLIGL